MSGDRPGFSTSFCDRVNAEVALLNFVWRTLLVTYRCFERARCPLKDYRPRAVVRSLSPPRTPSVAALVALATNVPLPYREISVVATMAEVRAHWNAPGLDAAACTTATRATLLQSAQRANSLKTWLLVVAQAMEGIAFILFLVVVARLIN